MADNFSKILIGIALIAALGIFGLDKWSNVPQNFEDCILEHLEDAHTDRAVRLLFNICEDKYSKK